MTERPRLLPLLGRTGHTSRDSMTCLYRCGNACDHPVPNTSGNDYLGDVVRSGMTRRGILGAGAASAAGVLVLGVSASPAGASPAVASPVPELLENLSKGKA